jgi:hypothetical protein
MNIKFKLFFDFKKKICESQSSKDSQKAKGQGRGGGGENFGVRVCDREFPIEKGRTTTFDEPP